MRKIIFDEVFRRLRIFLPVIHPVSRETALASIDTAVGCGADGVFLIDQGMSTHQLLDFIPEIHRRFESLWIGVNLLKVNPEDVIRLIKDLPISGIWSDNAGIDERSSAQPVAERFRQARLECSWDGLYFGGVAFKYQREVPHACLQAVAQNAVPWMDVITSSGPGTGQAAPVEKVKELRTGAGKHRLALASGVSPENVDGFLRYVDAFLVASEIETKSYSGILVPQRTKTLADKIHAWTDKA